MIGHGGESRDWLMGFGRRERRQARAMARRGGGKARQRRVDRRERSQCAAARRRAAGQSPSAGPLDWPARMVFCARARCLRPPRPHRRPRSGATPGSTTRRWPWSPWSCWATRGRCCRHTALNRPPLRLPLRLARAGFRPRHRLPVALLRATSPGGCGSWSARSWCRMCVFECAARAVPGSTSGARARAALFRDPHWPMWYLAALFLWRLMTPIFTPAARRSDRGGRQPRSSPASTPVTPWTWRGSSACCRSSCSA